MPFHWQVADLQAVVSFQPCASVLMLFLFLNVEGLHLSPTGTHEDLTNLRGTSVRPSIYFIAHRSYDRNVDVSTSQCDCLSTIFFYFILAPNEQDIIAQCQLTSKNQRNSHAEEPYLRPNPLGLIQLQEGPAEHTSGSHTPLDHINIAHLSFTTISKLFSLIIPMQNCLVQQFQCGLIIQKRDQKQQPV